MSNDFYTLKPPSNFSQEICIIESQRDFIEKINSRNYISDLMYHPNYLGEDRPLQRPIKIEGITFINVSFTRTEIENVQFEDCTFSSCLFIGTTFKNCKFIGCDFRNSNTDAIKFEDTYINPKNFLQNYRSIDKSNLAIHLFSELLNNATDEAQPEYKVIAKYHFKCWKRKLIRSKYKRKELSAFTCIKDTLMNTLSFIVGHGIRIRNLLITSATIFYIFFAINGNCWKCYNLQKSSCELSSCSPITEFNNIDNFLYTFTNMTQLISTQFQPTTSIGLFMNVVQGSFGFILLTFSITILINKFTQ